MMAGLPSQPVSASPGSCALAPAPFVTESQDRSGRDTQPILRGPLQGYALLIATNHTSRSGRGGSIPYVSRVPRLCAGRLGRNPGRVSSGPEAAGTHMADRVEARG
jgi:hypothetical protein